jgi:undecaprenyl-diphosphatase
MWAFLGRRLSPSEYLGLHLTIGLLVTLLSAALFAVIAHHVIGDTAVTRFDREVSDQLHAHALDAPILTGIMRLLTKLGGLPFLTILAVGVALVLLRLRQRWLALAWILTLAGGGLLDAWLKGIFARDRPVFADPLIHEPTLSFPSGHSMGSLCSYGMLAYLLSLRLQRWPARLAVIAGLGLLVLAIGFTRIYLGAHWLSDVIGGYAAAAVWLAFCISAVEMVRRHPNRKAERGNKKDPGDFPQASG